MRNQLISRTIARAGPLRRLPVARLLALAEVAVLAREHMNKLDPHDRRRLAELVRQGRGRPSSLSGKDRRELSALVAKLEPRVFVHRAVEKVTGVPVPGRGRRKR
jgi:predicted ArsR family transcriptional regulator